MALAFPANPLAVKVEILLNGVWTDITSFLYYRNLINIQGMGRPNEGSTIQAAEVTLTLNNRDGRFTPKNASGAYYPNIVRNVQIRISVNAQSSTAVVYNNFRFWGEISKLPVKWDSSGSDIYADITASGIWRRVLQMSNSLGSAFKRYTLGLTGGSVPQYYIPIEDGSGSTQLVPSIPVTGASNTLWSGGLNLASNSAFHGSDAIVTFNGASITATIPGGGTATNNVIRFLLDVPAAGDSASGTTNWNLVEIDTAGTVAKIEVFLNFAGTLFIQGKNAGGTILFGPTTTTTNVKGNPVLVSVELTSGLNWALRLITQGAVAITESKTGVATGTLGLVTSVKFNRASALNDSSVGHMSVTYGAIPSLVTAANALGGYAGEFAMDRFIRLCAENGIPTETIGTSSSTAKMGPQVDATLPALIQTIEDVDAGLLYEARGQFALGYRSLTSMSNQAVALTLNYATSQILGPLEPVYDDQLTHNNITVSDQNGYTVQSVLTSGPMSVAAPPSGIGPGYNYTRQVCVLADSQVAGIATWLLNIGSVDENRYPGIPLDLSRPEVAALFSSIPSTRIGDFVQVTNPPPHLPAGPINQLAWGYSEQFGSFSWFITFNTVPESPYVTGFTPGTIQTHQLPGGSAVTSQASGQDQWAQLLQDGGITPSMLNNGITIHTLGGNAVTISASAPASPNINDIWIASATGLISFWDGAAWQPQTFDGHTVINGGSITTSEILAGTIVASNIAAGTITAALLAAGIVKAGIVDATTITGSQLIAYGVNGQVLVYSGTPTTGNLIASISGASGSDTHSNSWGQGTTSFGAAGAACQVNGAVVGLYSGVTQLASLSPTGLFIRNNAGTSLLTAIAPASGTDSQTSTAYQQGITIPSGVVSMGPVGSVPAGVTGLGILYCGGGSTAPFWVDEFNVSASIERSQINTANFSLSQGNTTESQFSSSFALPANGAEPASELVCVIEGNGTWPNAVLTLHINMDGNLFCTTPIGAAAIGSGTACAFRITATITFVTAAGAGSSLLCSFSGDIVNTSGNRNYTNTATSGGAPIVGFSSNTYNSTLSHTFEISGSFAAGGAAASITTFSTRWNLRGGLG